MFTYERVDGDAVDAGRLTLRREGTRWLSSGFGGGYLTTDAAHNLTVPEGFDRTDLSAYAAERLGDLPAGPTLLTGVGQRHARGARFDPVEVVATAGLSNPASLPVEIGRTSQGESDSTEYATGREMEVGSVDDREDGPDARRPGTVNVFVGTTRSLDDGALAGLLATAVEAKAATLLAAADVPGTTSDAVVVGCDPDGEPSAFAGSAKEVGAATRACVRDAGLASLVSRYPDGEPPSLEEAEYGLSTQGRSTVFEP